MNEAVDDDAIEPNTDATIKSTGASEKTIAATDKKDKDVLVCTVAAVNGTRAST